MIYAVYLYFPKQHDLDTLSGVIADGTHYIYLVSPDKKPIIRSLTSLIENLTTERDRLEKETSH